MRTVSTRRGLRAMRFLILGLAFAAMAPASSFGLCPGGACSAPGGGPFVTDCMVEYDGITLNNPPTRPRGIICTDGDPACDVDAVPNGACNFRITACLNNPDPRFATCVTPNVSSITVKNQAPTSPRFSAGLAALQSAMQALVPTSSNVCTAPQSVSVPLRVRGGVFRPGTLKLRSTGDLQLGRQGQR